MYNRRDIEERESVDCVNCLTSCWMPPLFACIVTDQIASKYHIETNFCSICCKIYWCMPCTLWQGLIFAFPFVSLLFILDFLFTELVFCFMTIGAYEIAYRRGTLPSLQGRSQGMNTSPNDASGEPSGDLKYPASIE